MDTFCRTEAPHLEADTPVSTYSQWKDSLSSPFQELRATVHLICMLKISCGEIQTFLQDSGILLKCCTVICCCLDAEKMMLQWGHSLTPQCHKTPAHKFFLLIT